MLSCAGLWTDSIELGNDTGSRCWCAPLTPILAQKHQQALSLGGASILTDLALSRN